MKKTTKAPPKASPVVAAKIVQQLRSSSQPQGKPATDEDARLMGRRLKENDEKVKEKIKKKKSPPQEANPKVKKFLATAMDRWAYASEAERTVRKECLEDLQFSIGNQWDSLVKSQRDLDRRPCLTINRLPQFIRMVTNEQRQQRPAIQINPVGDGADVETARILQGMVRHIEVNSDAEVAYDTGSEFAVRIGFGYWRVDRDYKQGLTFEQEIKIKRIKNPFCVYFDPDCIEHDYSDAEWAFVIQDVPRNQFGDEHPEANIASLSMLSSIGDRQMEWATRETIRIAEYFYMERKERTFCFLPDGTVCYEEDVPEDVKPILTRKASVRSLKKAKITALDILEGNEDLTEGADQDGQYIPIVPVLGDDFDVDGQRYLAGIVRNARDPQRMYNYWISAATETIALAPRAPFIGVLGQFRSKEEMWRQANIRNFAFLEYDPTTVNGQAAPPPQRNMVEPPIQAISRMTAQADNDLKGTTGIYDASLGQKGPDESGKAILARQRQGDVSTLNYSDNLSRSIRHTGRIILDLIPSTYDRARIQRIIKPDQTVSYVGVFNSKIQQGLTPQAALEQLTSKSEGSGDPAIQKVFDIGVGSYDVSVSVGPSFQSKRQEAVSAMMALVGSYPQLMQVAGDLLISNMDWPGAEAIALRLRKMLPPQLQETDSADPQTQLIAAQAQLQALMQQHDLLVKALNDATETIKTKKLDLESKERIADMNAKVQLLVAEAKVQGEASLAMLNSQIQMINARLQLLNEGQSIESEDLSTPAPPQPPIPQAPPGVGAAPPPQGQPQGPPVQPPPGGAAPPVAPGVR
jgi:hypothetical protein